MPSLLSVDTAAGVLATNPVYLGKREAVGMLKALIARPRRMAGRCGLISGPEGIGKSSICLILLEDWADRIRAEWDLMSPHDRLLKVPYLTEEKDGVMYFRKPYTHRTNDSTVPAFVHDLHATAGEDQLLFADDFRPIDADGIGMRFRRMIHAATDDYTDGLVSMRNFINKDEPDLNWHGMLLINLNRRLTERVGGEKSVLDLFGKPLFDRFERVEICFTPQEIFKFLLATAFMDDRNVGLWEYLVRPNMATYPDDWPDAGLRGVRIPLRERGCGFEGTDDEAVTLLCEVMEEFILNWQRFKTLSYRALRRRTIKRVWAASFEDWKASLSHETIGWSETDRA